MFFSKLLVALILTKEASTQSMLIAHAANTVEYEFNSSNDIVERHSSLRSKRKSSTEETSKIKEWVAPTDLKHRILPPSTCGDNEQLFRIDITTDNHGYENRWKLMKITRRGAKKIHSGPGSSRNYSANQSTVGLYCLTPGTYKFVITDLSEDGMCCKFGRGKYVGSIGGARTFSSPDGGADWKRRTHQFEIDESKTDDEPKTNLPLDPKIGTGAMTSRDRDWLKSHNTRREKWHKRYDQEYVPLQWSPALMRESRTWAEKLARDCTLVHDQNSKYGENIALNYGSGGYAQMRPTENILTRFVEDEANVRYPENGHFTQVLWRATAYVGCADASQPRRGGGMCHTQVCRYAKPGNCNMSKYKEESSREEWWLEPMLMDDSPCGRACPPDGCI